MKMTKDQFIDTLRAEAIKQGIELTDNICDNLYEYKELIVEWNEKINLTTITEDYDVITKHIVDSLIVTKYIEVGQKIIDVGTGAGLPGIVISIYFEGKVDITLLDSLNKRVIFLKHVINKLNLKNIYAVHSRAEDYCHKKEGREVYDLAVARAVAGLNILAEYLSGYVKQQGQCIFMKAGDIKEELDNSENCFENMNLILEKKDKYEIDNLKEKLSRTIIVAKKTAKLENIYPRSFDKIKKKPF